MSAGLALSTFFAGLPAHYEELDVRPERSSARANKSSSGGHHTGIIAGTPFTVGFVHVWTLRGGLAIGFREYTDSGKLLPLFPAT